MSFNAAKSHLRGDLSLKTTVSINQTNLKHLPSSGSCPEHLFFSLDYFWCPPGRPQPFWRTHSSRKNLLVVQPRYHPATICPAWTASPRLSFILSSPTLDEVNFGVFIPRAAPRVSLTATDEPCHVVEAMPTCICATLGSHATLHCC